MKKADFTIDRFFKYFDCAIRKVTGYSKLKQAGLEEQLVAEAKMFFAVKKPKEASASPGEAETYVIDHLTHLVGVINQRVSASLSHVSLMLGALVFSFNYFSTANSRLKYAVMLETILYLFIAVCLLRCIRHFGLYTPIFTPGQDQAAGLSEFRDTLLRGLGLRYHLLHVVNFLAVLGALVFATLFLTRLVRASFGYA